MSQPARVGVLASFGGRNMLGGFKGRPTLLNPLAVGRALHKLKEEGDLTQVRMDVIKSEFPQGKKWDVTKILFHEFVKKR